MSSSNGERGHANKKTVEAQTNDFLSDEFKKFEYLTKKAFSPHKVTKTSQDKEQFTQHKT
jgi:hypothetical protein